MKKKSKKAKTFNDWAYLAIEKHTVKFTSHEAGVLLDRDIEELHQMRIGMRKLRSALIGFASTLKLPKSAGKKQVANISRTLGKLRDIDVLLLTIEEKYLPVLPENEQVILQQVYQQIKKQRKKVFKIVSKTLQGDRYLKLKKALYKWLKKPHFLQKKSKHKNVVSNILIKNIESFFAHEGWQLGTEDNLSTQQVSDFLAQQGYILHDLRKQAKNCRYQMELFKDFYGDEYRQYLREIKNIQTVLGNLQDDAVFTNILNELINANWSKQMPSLEEIMLHDRYEDFLKWQQLKTKFSSLTEQRKIYKVLLR